MRHPEPASSLLSRRWAPLLLAGMAVFFLAADVGPDASSSPHGWAPFGLLTSASVGWFEILTLGMSFLVAVGALVYTYLLAKRVYQAPLGTPHMQEIAAAIRQGADAYMWRQFKAVGLLVVLISAILILIKWPWDPNEAGNREEQIVTALGRGGAFLLGAVFSATVGFVGMRLATAGNLRVAARAKEDFGGAFRLAYRTGTVTGMLTVGLGLLGGTSILIVFGEKAYEILLGYGFGGSLLALFMRVGGGIYTKAADVGADLVGKVEEGMEEDDPRNAATIADNVGDNVGDCAGMAADVFESYAVTMVAAVMLGYAALGPKGMIFPIAVQALGAVSSMISTALVGRGMREGDSGTAMRSINHGFWRSAGLSAAGFMILGVMFLQFDEQYIVRQGLERGLYMEQAVQSELGMPIQDVRQWKSDLTVARNLRTAVGDEEADELERQIQSYHDQMLAAWDALEPEERQTLTFKPVVRTEGDEPMPLVELARAGDYTPLQSGMHLAAAFAALVGIGLAIALNRNTEYWTSTEHDPVKAVTKSCRTGDATTIISGIALGYESAVVSVLWIAGAIMAGVWMFADTESGIFLAFGVSMVGIGMLCLTGDTISMDVFGPVADNANGIGEMAYNRDSRGQALREGDPDYIPEDQVREARRILTDLDAVGNTTKAITKGIAIGSAVIAAVSLFASFIAVLITGSEEKVGQLSTVEFLEGQKFLTVAAPEVFIGMLIGGAVPMLFSSMTIRAVGRAAYLIVNECRRQFKDPGIMDGTRRPNYGKVVNICTATAQKELIGPGLLAIGTPLIVGFLLGPFALGGFLAGMIVSGQLLAVFMSNAGGAWDNAKKMVEDEPRSAKTGKGSSKHKASVTGDTVGDPLKDTAGPAINPLIKVMNMVSLLALPFVLRYSLDRGSYANPVGWVVLIVAVVVVGFAWWQSDHPSREEQAIDEELTREEERAIRDAQRE